MTTMNLAGMSMKPLHGHEKQVFDAVVVAVDGMTDDELSKALGISHQSVSARRRGLVQRGYLQDSKRKRTTTSGNHATVWILGTGKPEAGRPAAPSNQDLRAIIALLPREGLDSDAMPKAAAARAWLESFIKPEPVPGAPRATRVVVTKAKTHRRLSGKAWSRTRGEGVPV